MQNRSGGEPTKVNWQATDAWVGASSELGSDPLGWEVFWK